MQTVREHIFFIYESTKKRTVAAYIKKNKTNDSKFKRILKKFKGSCPISKYELNIEPDSSRLNGSN